MNSIPQNQQTDTENSIKYPPNTHPMPNQYQDVLMQYLTPTENMVLAFIYRQIAGYPERRSRNSHPLSVSFISGGNSRFGGTGLSISAIVKAIEGLERFRLIEPVKYAPNNNGEVRALLFDYKSGTFDKVDLDGLKARNEQTKASNRKKTEPTRKAKESKKSSVKQNIESTSQHDQPFCPTEDHPSVGQNATLLSDRKIERNGKLIENKYVSVSEVQQFENLDTTPNGGSSIPHGMSVESIQVNQMRSQVQVERTNTIRMVRPEDVIYNPADRSIHLPDGQVVYACSACGKNVVKNRDGVCSICRTAREKMHNTTQANKDVSSDPETAKVKSKDQSKLTAEIRDIIMDHWMGMSNFGFAGIMAQQLLGISEHKQNRDFNLRVPASPAEVLRFVEWWKNKRRGKNGNVLALPTAPDTLERSFCEFRNSELDATRQQTGGRKYVTYSTADYR